MVRGRDLTGAGNERGEADPDLDRVGDVRSWAPDRWGIADDLPKPSAVCLQQALGLVAGDPTSGHDDRRLDVPCGCRIGEHDRDEQ